jgi:prevent-host-death family protein
MKLAWSWFRFNIRAMQTKTISDLRQKGAALFASLKSSSAPVLLTRGGKPAAYLLGVDAFDALSQRLSILEGLAAGERAVEEGRTVSHAKARKRLQRWLN